MKLKHLFGFLLHRRQEVQRTYERQLIVISGTIFRTFFIMEIAAPLGVPLCLLPLSTSAYEAGFLAHCLTRVSEYILLKKPPQVVAGHAFAMLKR